MAKNLVGKGFNQSKGVADLMFKIQYKFSDISLLEQALVHSSFANERRNPIPSNERLEFLGDSVLGFITAEYLFGHYPDSEGELTRLRASLVCEKALFSYAQQLGLGDFIRLGKGEEKEGGSKRPSILSDAFEAVTAAIYLDGGIERAKEFIIPFIEDEINTQKKPKFIDYKTALQEIIQQNPEEKLSYRMVDEQGPDHDKIFWVEVRLNSNVIGKGKGKSKKEAEQSAAKGALSLLGYDDIR